MTASIRLSLKAAKALADDAIHPAHDRAMHDLRAAIAKAERSAKVRTRLAAPKKASVRSWHHLSDAPEAEDEEQFARPASCGQRDWQSATSIPANVTCKRCLAYLRAKGVTP